MARCNICPEEICPVSELKRSETVTVDRKFLSCITLLKYLFMIRKTGSIKTSHFKGFVSNFIGYKTILFVKQMNNMKKIIIIIIKKKELRLLGNECRLVWKQSATVMLRIFFSFQIFFTHPNNFIDLWPHLLVIKKKKLVSAQT